MGIFKSPLAPLGLCTITMGVASALILHPLIGVGVILFGACLLVPGVCGAGEADDRKS